MSPPTNLVLCRTQQQLDRFWKHQSICRSINDNEQQIQWFRVTTIIIKASGNVTTISTWNRQAVPYAVKLHRQLWNNANYPGLKATITSHNLPRAETDGNGKLRLLAVLLLSNRTQPVKPQRWLRSWSMCRLTANHRRRFHHVVDLLLT